MATTGRRNPNLLGPAGLCDHCGRQCCTLDQVGIVCYHCHAGTFVHRSFWAYKPCPACHGTGNFCEACHRTGVCAEPLDDFTLDMPALRAFWQMAIARCLENQEEVPDFMLAGASASGFDLRDSIIRKTDKSYVTISL